jgi:predicted tellurium resistance membrane protein TerC
MQEFFSIPGLTTLAMLVLLQAVLGFDNLLYISIESKRAPEDKQQWVRRVGIVMAIFLRIALLLLIMTMIEKLGDPLFSVKIENPFEAREALAHEAASDKPGGAPYLLFGEFTLHSLITLFGGAFILYTAVKEVLHLLAVDEIEHGAAADKPKPVGRVLFMIVVMNLVFSFDSILSAMALTKNFWIMAAAIIISGAMMVYLADTVSEFLKKNRMYEVLGLFILFIVGVMLLGEGGHLSHLTFFTYHVEPMAKSTFYFTLAVLVLIDVVQSKYRKKLLAQRNRELSDDAA